MVHCDGIDGSNIVGAYQVSMINHGFLYNGPTYTTLDDPLEKRHRRRGHSWK